MSAAHRRRLMAALVLRFAFVPVRAVAHEVLPVHRVVVVRTPAVLMRRVVEAARLVVVAVLAQLAAEVGSRPDAALVIDAPRVFVRPLDGPVLWFTRPIAEAARGTASKAAPATRATRPRPAGRRWVAPGVSAGAGAVGVCGVTGGVFATWPGGGEPSEVKSVCCCARSLTLAGGGRGRVWAWESLVKRVIPGTSTAPCRLAPPGCVDALAP